MPAEKFTPIAKRLSLEESPSGGDDVVAVFEMEDKMYLEAHCPKEKQNAHALLRRGDLNVTFSLGGFEATYGHPMDPPDVDYKAVVSGVANPVTAALDLQAYYRQQAIGEFLMASQEQENDLSLAAAMHRDSSVASGRTPER